MKTERVNRLNSLIKDKLGDIIRRELEVSAHALISITDVDTAADLSQCRVSVSIFTTDPKEQQKVFHQLIKQVKHLRYELANAIEIRKTPRLVMVLDDSLEKSDRLTRLIEGVK